jgi:hypothetical protein
LVPEELDFKRSRISIEIKGIEVKISGIGHRSREVGKKTCSRRVKIKSSLRVILAAVTVEDLLKFVAVISVANKSNF